jgi:hypothetical protein
MRIRFIISFIVVLIAGFIIQMKARKEIAGLKNPSADTSINYDKPLIRDSAFNTSLLIFCR